MAQFDQFYGRCHSLRQGLRNNQGKQIPSKIDGARRYTATAHGIPDTSKLLRGSDGNFIVLADPHWQGCERAGLADRDFVDCG